MSRIARHNHYVPQAYLRRWAANGRDVWAYRTLVSNSAVPAWKLKPVRGIAYWKDLYTSYRSDTETDEFERWIGRRFEEPGLEAIAKVAAGQRLTPRDWNALAWFAFIQDQRTPAAFADYMLQCQVQIPEAMDRAFADLSDTITQGVLTPRKSESAKTTLGPLSECVRIHRRSASVDDKNGIRYRGFCRAKTLDGPDSVSGGTRGRREDLL